MATTVNMARGEYVGPIAHLKGERAILIVREEGLRAQFDDVSLTRGTFPSVSLGYGWHDFDDSDFHIFDHDN